MKRILCVVLILLALACKAEPEETGTLTGHVTIGPLVPVSRAGVPDPTPAPEVYALRKIVIFDGDGQDEVVRAEIDGEGNYEVTLPVGVYMVDINHLGVDRAMDLPARIEVLSGRVTVLDIDIDTGIR